MKRNLSQRQALRDDAVRLRDILREVRRANSDGRSFALFDARDALQALGIDADMIDGFDAADDAALDRHIGQAHAVATALGAPDDADHTALFGDADEVTVTGSAAPEGLVRGPRVGDELLGSAPENRLYRKLFISPDDVDPNNPVDRLQIVDVANADDEGMGMVDKAIRYLNRSPTARATIDDGLRRGIKINLIENAVDNFDPVSKVVSWDPRSQLRLIDRNGHQTDDYQSPAMGLGHEFEHINDSLWPGGGREIIGTSEEKAAKEAANALEQARLEGRIQLDYEWPVGSELGEPAQTAHRGILYRTNDPTSRTPGHYDAFNTEHEKEYRADIEANRRKRYTGF